MPQSPAIIQILLLLGCTVAVVVVFQRLRLPSSLGYLLVGVLLGPHTAGPVVDAERIGVVAEFGIVFLLFTIGLNFSLPQIYALRHLLLGLGTAQVLLTTVAVGAFGWLAGLPTTAAFVVGAVFAQSSTTIISKQLTEQGEDQQWHARLSVAMSVFQDVTAVPFVVVIPVLSAAAGVSAMSGALFWALAKALLAFALVFIVGRWLLRPVFHEVASRRSPELFTLTVLFVSLIAGWVTQSLGLSMAFGAFLAGMVLGETEFRHQVESTIRPFKDVLLGLFFIGIGLLIDPAMLMQVWPWSLLGAALLLTVKAALVAGIVRFAKIDWPTAWRTGLLLAVGGEFGFALLALGLQHRLIDEWLGQVVLGSVLFSMIVAPALIRYNANIAKRLSPKTTPHAARIATAPLHSESLSGHVLICGFGRVGQGLGRLLEAESIPHVAIDLDPVRVRQARAAGCPVHFGDATHIDVLELLGLSTARMVVISHADTDSAVKTLKQLRLHHPSIAALVRSHDQSRVNELIAAGATEVIPETLEAGLMIASQALLLAGVPLSRVLSSTQQERSAHYRQQRELFKEAGDAKVRDSTPPQRPD